MRNLPPLKLDHLRRMTDGTGLVQWAMYSVPDPHSGYSIDDNARALVVALMHYQQTGDPASVELARRYLSFLRYAQTAEGQFHNFLGFDRRWLDRVGGENSQGWAAWALSYAAAAGVEEGMRRAARDLLETALPWVDALEAPRAIAFSLLGLAALDDVGPMSIERLGARLLDRFETAAQPGWEWFEDYLTYCNGALPHALLAAGRRTGDRRMLDVGRRSLDFLLSALFRDGMLDLIGNDGWWVRGRARAEYDQQPVDAAGAVEVCLAAWQAFGDRRYYELAWAAFDWFHGRNRLQAPLLDEATGGVRDGLTPGGVNLNEGAESTLAYLYSCLLLQQYAPPD